MVLLHTRDIRVDRTVLCEGRGVHKETYFGFERHPAHTLQSGEEQDQEGDIRQKANRRSKEEPSPHLHEESRSSPAPHRPQNCQVLLGASAVEEEQPDQRIRKSTFFLRRSRSTHKAEPQLQRSR